MTDIVLFLYSLILDFLLLCFNDRDATVQYTEVGFMKVQTIWLKGPVDEGIPQPEHFEVRQERIEPAEMEDGDFLLQVLVMSADPYLRGSIRSSNPLHSASSSTSQRVMTGFVAGKIVESKNALWKKGATMKLPTDGTVWKCSPKPCSVPSSSNFSSAR